MAEAETCIYNEIRFHFTVAMYCRCWGDIDPNVVAESVKGEFVVVDCVDEGGKNGPPEKVKCDPYPAAFSRLLGKQSAREELRLIRYIAWPSLIE